MPSNIHITFDPGGYQVTTDPITTIISSSDGNPGYCVRNAGPGGGPMGFEVTLPSASTITAVHCDAKKSQGTGGVYTATVRIKLQGITVYSTSINSNEGWKEAIGIDNPSNNENVQVVRFEMYGGAGYGYTNWIDNCIIE